MRQKIEINLRSAIYLIKLFTWKCYCWVKEYPWGVKMTGSLGTFPEPVRIPYSYVRAGIHDTSHVRPSNAMVQITPAWLAG